MVKIYKILIVLMLVISFSIYLKGQYISELDYKKDPWGKPFSETVIIQNLIQLENLINKELPTIEDMENFNMGYGDKAENDLYCRLHLLENLENWGFTKEEYELITKEYPDRNKGPCCYLMLVQKILKKDSKGPVKIYIPLKQEKCYILMGATDYPWLAKDIDATIKVDGKYKEVTFKMACNKLSVNNYGNLIDIKINNKVMNNPSVWKHSYELLLEEKKK